MSSRQCSAPAVFKSKYFLLTWSGVNRGFSTQDLEDYLNKLGANYCVVFEPTPQGISDGLICGVVDFVDREFQTLYSTRTLDVLQADGTRVKPYIRKPYTKGIYELACQFAFVTRYLQPGLGPSLERGESLVDRDAEVVCRQGAFPTCDQVNQWQIEFARLRGKAAIDAWRSLDRGSDGCAFERYSLSLPDRSKSKYKAMKVEMDRLQLAEKSSDPCLAQMEEAKPVEMWFDFVTGTYYYNGIPGPPFCVCDRQCEPCEYCVVKYGLLVL